MEKDIKTEAAAVAAGAKKTPKEKAAALHTIYAGPNVAQAGLFHWAVFRNGYPPNVQELMDKFPWVGAMFVPVGEAASARIALQGATSPLSILSARLLKAFAKKEA